MSKVDGFRDYLYIDDCYKALHAYKAGQMDERGCLIRIAENFEAME
jgi:hypothetical protein